MDKSYLDIEKSVMISSPAGSGKTEKLSRRYISLLKSGSDVEKILAITFTEKAAAEMKERILGILEKEDRDLFEEVRRKMPRMRISTIHSFCLKLLKRFCLDLDLDPALEVMDAFNADILWNESVYEALLEESSGGRDLFYGVIRKSGIKGWNKLHEVLDELHGKRPHIEFGILNSGFGSRCKDPERFGLILEIYSKCLEKYRRKKRERRSLDYNDLELLAHEAISGNPEWQNLLYAFDERTDHILVDEFQDTSSLQWRIIDKLTEEWRSGLGAKREAGLRPTLFLVGDDKQSIYSFRGANAGIFRSAKERLSEWLGDEYHFLEVKENYRSLPAIIDFVNGLFERLMPKGLYEKYRVEYTPFEPTRRGEGGVKLALCESVGNTKANRKAEAAVVATEINKLAGERMIHYEGGTRPCSYGDMAVLLRSRTHLPVFEDALRKEGIPFVVVKGVGFYNSPEIGVIKNLLFFLIDPFDDYSLFNVLRSPLFSADYESILKALGDPGRDGPLIESITGAAPALELFPEAPAPGLAAAADTLNSWLLRAKGTPYSVMLEEIFEERGTWGFFHERQRYMNVRKFIRLIEEFEAGGLSGIEIREKLIRAASKADEAKANINTEGMNAVRIMTVHGAKGLQFPVVFLPCLDEGSSVRTGNIVMDEEGDGMTIGYEEDPDVRKTLPVFRRHREKMEEEEKRLFYVAATRAMDDLHMSGVMDVKPSGKLAYIFDAFDLTAEIVRKNERAEGLKGLSVSYIPASALPRSHVLAPSSDLPGFRASALSADLPVFPCPVDYRPGTVWSDVTEETDEDEIRKRHGEDWIVLGRAFHRIFEALSKGHVTRDRLEEKTVEVLRNESLSDEGAQRMKGIILSDIARLEDAGFLQEIVLPLDGAYAELPFVMEHGSRIYKGRIDRVIVRTEDRGDCPGFTNAVVESGLSPLSEKVAYIYDYKTYPVSDGEIARLRERYAFQMGIYREAVERMFGIKAKTLLFFTHMPVVMSAD